MSGYGLCWPIKLFFSAPLQHGIMGFIFPLLCHLSIKWANLHHSSWTKKERFWSVCLCVEGDFSTGICACLVYEFQHLCAALPLCLFVEA